MLALLKRLVKGTPLTHAEHDQIHQDLADAVDAADLNITGKADVTALHDGTAQDNALATHVADGVAHAGGYDDTAISGRVTTLEAFDHTGLHDGAAQDTAIGLKADQTALNTEIASTNTEQTAQDGRLTALEAVPPPIVDPTPTDGSANAVSSDGVFDALAAAAIARALLVPKSDKADAAAVTAGTVDRWIDALELRTALDALDFAGDYQGSAATYAGLPASTTSGDWAILNVDDGPNLSGIYVTDGATYSLAKTIPDFAAGVLANFLSADADFAAPKSWSGQVLESWRHSNENFTTLADGGTAEVGTGRSVDPGSTIAAPVLRIDGSALVTGDYFQLALTADGAVTVTGVAETTTFAGLQASSHAWYYTGTTWVDLDPQISDLLTQAEIDDSTSTEEGTVTGALLHATFKPDIIVDTQIEANTTSVLDGQRLQIGRGANYLATQENISGATQIATSANRSDGTIFAYIHRWFGAMLRSNGEAPFVDDSNLYFSDWTVGVTSPPIRDRSHYYVGIIQATEAAWDGTQEVEWTYYQSVEFPPASSLYIWAKDVSQAIDDIVYPGNNGAVQVGKENVYYLDETIGTIPPATTGKEYAISILQANTTDSQAIKDAAKSKVSHFRAVDTGAGFIWIETDVISDPGLDASAAWQAAFDYTGTDNVQFSAQVGIASVVDIGGTPLIQGKTYNLFYPTDQTSGALLDLTEFAKMELIGEVATSDAEGNFLFQDDASVQVSRIDLATHTITPDYTGRKEPFLYTQFSIFGASTITVAARIDSDLLRRRHRIWFNNNTDQQVTIQFVDGVADPVQGYLQYNDSKTAAQDIVIASTLKTVCIELEWWNRGCHVRQLSSGVELVLYKNQADFTAGNLTFEFYQDDPGGGFDGKYYPDLTATANFTFPTVVGNNGKRILIATDWAARATAAGPPTWTTQGAEILELPASGWPAEGTEFVWAIADETNTKWLIRTSGNIELSYVVPSFVNDADAATGTVAGSLFQGTGTGDLNDALYRVEADSSRTLVG